MTRSRLLISLVGLVLLVSIPAVSTYSAFSKSTSNDGSTFTAATSFTTTCATGTETLVASADTQVQERSIPPHPDFSGTTDTIASETQAVAADETLRQSFLRFSTPAARAGCKVTSAKLRFHANYVDMDDTFAPRYLSARRVLVDWVEFGTGEMTWANRPQGTSLASTATGNVASGASGSVGWREIEVAPDVQSMVYSGTANYGWRIWDEADPLDMDTIGFEVRFRSREYSDTTLRPQLVVTFGA